MTHLGMPHRVKLEDDANYHPYVKFAYVFVLGCPPLSITSLSSLLKYFILFFPMP